DPSDPDRGRRLLDLRPRDHRRLAARGPAALALLPLHEDRPGDAGGGAEPGVEPPDRDPRHLDDRARLGAGGRARGRRGGLRGAPTLGSFDQNFMQPILLYAFAGAVLGGIDSALGAVLGSLALGVFLNLLGTYVSWIGTDLRQAAGLAVLPVVLLVKPSGLLGTGAVRRVRDARAS